MRIHLLLASALLAAVAMFGTGCKNDCQKAIDHMIGCMEDFCSDNECPEGILDQARERASAEAGECTEENATEAAELLNTSCEEITAGLALAVGLQNAMENAGGEGGEGGGE